MENIETAAAISERVNSGEIDAVEVVERSIDRTREAQRKYNCIAYECYDDALLYAKQNKLRGRLAGVPILLKDSGIAAKGLPTSIGSKVFEGTVYNYDANIVKRLKKEGAVIIGRSTVPELMKASTTEALRNGGPTRNPYDVGRSTGGSSGGAAVAVAVGAVPVAHGSDGGGSIRTPSACCGVFGIKPTRGLIENEVGEWVTNVLGVDGALTGTVEDMTLMIDVMSGKTELHKKYKQPNRKRLQIGVWNTRPWEYEVEEECMNAVNEAAEVCKKIGYEIKKIDIPIWDYKKFIQAMVTVVAVGIRDEVDERLENIGRVIQEEDLEPAIMEGYIMGGHVTGREYTKAMRAMAEISKSMGKMLKQCDVILSPTLTKVAPKLGEMSTVTNSFVRLREIIGELTPYLAIVNASGVTAGSMPLGEKNGIPIGVQAIAPVRHEGEIIAIAKELEKTELWRKHLK